MSRDYEQAVRSQIVCGVANVYYSLVMLNQQLDLTKRTSEIWKEQVESMELLKEAKPHQRGSRGSEPCKLLQHHENSIPTLETSLTTLHNTLSLLLNTYPQTWDVTSELDFTIPDNPVNGIPVSYLAVRPGVRAAERSLAAKILFHKQCARRVLSEPCYFCARWLHQSSRLYD